MWHSLGAVVPLPSPTYTADAAADLPESSLSYDVAAAALRQKDFFYQVSLPHYSLSFVRERAVERYATQGGCSLPLQGLPTRHSADCSYHRSIVIRSVIKQGVMQIIVIFAEVLNYWKCAPRHQRYHAGMLVPPICLDCIESQG